MGIAKRMEQLKTMRNGGNFIQKAIKHPGGLHRSLHVPEGKKIPKSRIEKALHSKSPLLRKRASLAKTLGKLRPRGR